MNTISKLGMGTAMLIAAGTGSGWAASRVQVSLWDKGGEYGDADGACLCSARTRHDKGQHGHEGFPWW